MRVNDSDRTRALENLKKLVDTGYLDLNDFEERSRILTTARTRDEVRGLFADIPTSALLPARRPETAPQTTFDERLAAYKAGRRKRWGAVVVVALASIAAANTFNSGLFVLLVPVVLVLIFIFKVGPKDWYAPSPPMLQRGKAALQQLTGSDNGYQQDKFNPFDPR